MVARVSTVSLQGIEAVEVDVQVQIASGLPAFSIVGLPDKAVAESRERVRSALAASGLALPPKRITINLAPADLPKEGSHYDLPIALGIMVAMGALPCDSLDHTLILGELALDGRIANVAGVLSSALLANQKEMSLICPSCCGHEAAWASEELDILAPDSLLQLVNHMKGSQTLSKPLPSVQKSTQTLPDLADVRGQDNAKRALEITAAGGHNLLMVGPPGSGKSMLAARLPSLLPPMSARELLDVSMIASVAGVFSHKGLSNQRPYRAPHHSASMAAMVGGGAKAKPGEISLAHQGVLFLDELPEFSPQVLDSLRQPLETGECLISRANHRITYPSQFQLIAAMNPCRCGHAGEPGHTCRRGARCADDYQARLSGPLLDRIDLRIDVPALSAQDMMHKQKGESSAEVALRVMRARMLQKERYQALGLSQEVNAHAPVPLLDNILRPHADGLRLLEQAVERTKMSARGYHRVIKLARTLADLEGTEDMHRHHIAEALSYRLPGERLLSAA